MVEGIQSNVLGPLTFIQACNLNETSKRVLTGKWDHIFQYFGVKFIAYQRIIGEKNVYKVVVLITSSIFPNVCVVRSKKVPTNRHHLIDLL